MKKLLVAVMMVFTVGTAFAEEKAADNQSDLVVKQQIQYAARRVEG